MARRHAAEDADVGDLVFADAVVDAVAERDLAVAEVVLLVMDRAVDEQRDDRGVAERGEDFAAVLRREHFDTTRAGREAGRGLGGEAYEEEGGHRRAGEGDAVASAEFHAEREEPVADKGHEEREERDAGHAMPCDPVGNGLIRREARELRGRERAGVDRVVVCSVGFAEKARFDRRVTDEVAFERDADLGREDGIGEFDVRHLDGAEDARGVGQLHAERRGRRRECVGGTREVDRAVGPITCLGSHVVERDRDDVGVLALHDIAVLGDGRDCFVGIGITERDVRHVDARGRFGDDVHVERNGFTGRYAHRREFVGVEADARGVEVEEFDDRLHADVRGTVVHREAAERDSGRGFDVRTGKWRQEFIAVGRDTDGAGQELHERFGSIGGGNHDCGIHPTEAAALGREQLDAHVVATGGNVRKRGGEEEGFVFARGQCDRRAHHVDHVGQSVFVADAAQFQAVLQAGNERVFGILHDERSGDVAAIQSCGDARHEHRLGFVGVAQVDRFFIAVAVRLHGGRWLCSKCDGRVERQCEKGENGYSARTHKGEEVYKKGEIMALLLSLVNIQIAHSAVESLSKRQFCHYTANMVKS